MYWGDSATIEKWERFNPLWRETLNREPRISYFKAREAGVARGQFSGWEKWAIDQRVSLLNDIACSSANYRVHVTLLRNDFDWFLAQMGGKVSDPYGFDWKDPYWICFFGIALAIAIHCRARGINDSCQYIFDEHGPLGPRAAVMWQLAKKSVATDISDFLGSPPIFLDDKKVLPLQAADLYAWHVRKVINGSLKIHR